MTVPKAALLGAVIVALAMMPTMTSPALGADNPIVVENQQPGSGGWQLTRSSKDATGQIKGYASATSVNQGQTITLFVSVNPAQTFTIEFFRVGWYAGQGARRRLHVGPLNGVRQAACPTDAATGLIACNWSASYVLTVPTDWTSGVYLGLLQNAQGYQNYVIFVVKDGRPAPLLYQQSVATYQAYNDWPDDGLTGKSLYSYNSYGANTVAGEKRAVKVSFDRPYKWSGAGDFFAWEIDFIRWIERSGYDVTYSTNVDTHVDGRSLRNHKAFLSVGHDEYWSKEMYDAAEAARDAGVSLGFFGANDVHWAIRFEASGSGVANRVMVGYKDETWRPSLDPVRGPTTTAKWQDPPLNRPEQSLMGVLFTATLKWGQNASYVVRNSSNWVYAGTGFRDGDVVAGIVGYEVDGFVTTFPPPVATTRSLLSHSTFTDAGGKAGNSDSSIYRAPSGAWVFAAGTMSWSWALDNYDHAVADARLQRATSNILNAFIAGTPGLP
jgi:hypothetical protein